MSAREDFIKTVNAVDARLEALRPRIVAAAERPLLEGTWRVRDALSHLAARSNGVARVLQRVEALDSGDATGAPVSAPRNIDEINAGQVQERSSKSVEELLDEIRDGHQAALAAVQGLDDDLLARSIPLGFRPGEATVAAMLTLGGPGHDGNHLDQVQAALDA
jgi:hypothetical protein